MSHPPPRRPRDDLFDRIEAEDEADEARRVLALDDAAIDRELAAGGLDPAAVRAKGRALGEERMRAAQRKRFRRVATFVPLSAAAAAILLFMMLPVTGGPGAGRPRETTSAPVGMRRAAKRECDEGHWAACLALLDRAKSLDPGGDATAEVTVERDRAVRAIEAGAGEAGTK